MHNSSSTAVIEDAGHFKVVWCDCSSSGMKHGRGRLQRCNAGIIVPAPPHTWFTISTRRPSIHDDSFRYQCGVFFPSFVAARAMHTMCFVEQRQQQWHSKSSIDGARQGT